MVAEGVSSELDFEWSAQMRMYFEKESVFIKMMQATVEYGYEYLGNSSRRVVTPLTDRCYRTLMVRYTSILEVLRKGQQVCGESLTYSISLSLFSPYCLLGLLFVLISCYGYECLISSLLTQFIWIGFDSYLVRYWKNRVNQRFSESFGATVRGLQLFRYPGCPYYGQVLQRPRELWSMGLLR